MTSFLIIYIILAVIIVLSVFFLSLYEDKYKWVKGTLLAIYLVTIIGVLFATGCLEVKYSMSRVLSTAIAAAIVLMLYCADSLGGKLKNK